MGWQPIETAPKDGSWILVSYMWLGEPKIWMAAWNEDIHSWLDRPGYCYPKHMQSWLKYWHPLPEPPKW